MGGASGSLVGEFDHRVVSAFSASWLSDWTRMAAAQAITINKERETDTTKDADGKTGEQKSDRRWEEKEIQWLILGFPHSKCRFFWGNLPLFSTQHAVWLWHYDSPARSLEQPCFIRNMMKNQQDSGYGPMPHAISSWLVWLVTINHYSSHCIIANPHYRIKWLVDVGCISHYTPISQYSWIIYIYIMVKPTIDITSMKPTWECISIHVLVVMFHHTSSSKRKISQLCGLSWTMGRKNHGMISFKQAIGPKKYPWW